MPILLFPFINKENIEIMSVSLLTIYLPKTYLLLTPLLTYVLTFLLTSA